MQPPAICASSDSALHCVASDCSALPSQDDALYTDFCDHLQSDGASCLLNHCEAGYSVSGGGRTYTCPLGDLAFSGTLACSGTCSILVVFHTEAEAKLVPGILWQA